MDSPGGAIEIKVTLCPVHLRPWEHILSSVRKTESTPRMRDQIYQAIHSADKTCNSTYRRRYRPTTHCLYHGHFCCWNLRAKRPCYLWAIQRQGNCDKKGCAMQSVQKKNMRWPDMYDVNPAGGCFSWSGKDDE